MIEVEFSKAELNRIFETMNNLCPAKRKPRFMSAMRKGCETLKNALVKNISGRRATHEKGSSLAQRRENIRKAKRTILNVITDTLRGSMMYNVGVEGSDIVGRVGSNVGNGKPVFYDKFLELGTKRMKAKRHKQITLKQTERKVKDDFIRFLDRTLKGAK